MIPRQAFAAVLALLPASAWAQDAFPPGVYLATPELCEQARKDGLQTVIEQSEIVLTARGLDAIEHNCRFLDIKTREGGGAWLAQALCEQPGYAYPDLYSLFEREPGRIEVNSLADHAIAMAGSNAPVEVPPEESADSGTVTRRASRTLD